LINKIRIHKIIKAQITIQALQNQFIIITTISILILIITIILITIINRKDYSFDYKVIVK